MFYSVVIPVFNRPEEVQELLESLTVQTFQNFEVLIIEDGSTRTCRHIAESFSKSLRIRYYFKENTGQGFSRNFGFERAGGDYFIVFDSDCIIPGHYFETIDRFLEEHPVDAFGGADRAHPSFTPLQKAISYSMTSLLTTGGIRGNEHHAGKFHPRSFNMGISREVYEQTGGYRITRMGEDIEFSIRIIKNDFETALIPEAFVYHKRRTSLKQFFGQLYFFGRARVNIGRYYPSEVRMIHMLPSLFTVGLLFYITTLFWNMNVFMVLSAAFGALLMVITVDAALKYKSFRVGLLSALTSLVQLTAYGTGFLMEIRKKI